MRNNKAAKGWAMCVGVLLLTALWAAPAQGQDKSGDPAYGSVTLKADFRPDPFKKALTAGGSNQIDKAGVKAYIATRPDFKLHYTAGTYPLTIHVQSKADTTLLIHLPDDTWVAADESSGGD
jgi:hypothetical protein